MAETTLILWDGSQTPDIHSLFIADFVDQQILLEVSVADLDRTALEEHGIDFRNAANAFVSAYFMGGGNLPLGSFDPTSTPLPKPTYAFNLPNNENITAIIQLLQEEGLATILAQPKLVAMSGQNAVFQVGGEIPIRIATGFAADVVFKTLRHHRHVRRAHLGRGRHPPDGHPGGELARLRHQVDGIRASSRDACPPPPDYATARPW